MSETTAVPLTHRQLELVLCLASGMRPRDIAEDKHLSKSSVDKTLARARSLAGASTNTHLVASAIVNNWLVYDHHAGDQHP